MSWLIGFCTGVALCGCLATLPDWRTLLLCGALLLLVRRLWPRHGVVVWQFCLTLLLGLSYAAWLAGRQLAQALPPEWERKPVSLEVIVRGLAVRGAHSTRLQVQVERCLTAGARAPPQLSLRIKPDQRWAGGSRWRIMARLSPVRATANRYGFDAERWMWGLGIQAQGGLVGLPEQLTDGMDVLARIDRLRSAVVERVQRVLGDSRAAALIRALTVGDQQGIAREDWRLFSQTGITHLVSISGVHVGMVAHQLLKRMALNRISLRVAVALSGLLAAAVYSLLAGWSVPTRRTFFMLAVAAVLLLWRRALSPFHIWWLALVIALLMDPFAVFFPGLWLSFGLVAALMLVVSGRRRPPTSLRAMLLGQWAASVMSIVPLILFFSALPLISPVANALAIPWVSILLAPLSLLAVVLPYDGLLWLAAWLVDLFYLVMTFLARVPLWSLPEIPWPLLLLGLCGSLWLIAPAGIPLRMLGAMMLLRCCSTLRRGHQPVMCGSRCWMSARVCRYWSEPRSTPCCTIPGR